LNKSANFYGWKIIAKKINENFRTDIFWNFTKIHLCKHNNNKNWRVKLVSRYFFVVRIKNDFITSSFSRYFHRLVFFLKLFSPNLKKWWRWGWKCPQFVFWFYVHFLILLLNSHSGVTFAKWFACFHEKTFAFEVLFA